MLSAGDFYAVSGSVKIGQDLYYACSEAYGSDPYHLLWGSILDRFVGLPLLPETQQQIIAELQRVISNYMSVQADQINARSTYSLIGLYSTADVIASVDSINATPVGDSLVVTVSLTTGSGQLVNVQVVSL